MFVLSGGEPLFRPDLFDIAAYGVETGFRMALATNGTLVTERVAAKIADTGISRVAISLDGANPDTHDRFRGQPGAHALAMRGLSQPARGRRLGPDQLDDREAQRHRAAGDARPGARDRRRRAAPVHAGAGRLRARDRADTRCCRPTSTSACCAGSTSSRRTCPIDLKATCAPHYYRIRAQRIEEERSRGDMYEHVHRARHAGQGRADAARRRRARPAPVGDDARLPGGHERLLRLERRRRLSVRLPAGERRRHARQRFKDIWTARRCFSSCAIRRRYEGKCGECRFEAICGGCRARAYAATGSFLAEEPFCTYRPDLDAPRSGARVLGSRRRTIHDRSTSIDHEEVSS